ncbi:MAG: type IX secretion system membrane protein PorP/SprF [Cryomorphaceae bacterium]|nr:type IX secretion system membrane protein PorP/SprF [Flavobacteriales bacterium]
MKKYAIAFTIVLGVSTYASAQQEPQFTQFMYDRLSINPAFAGTQDAICGTLLGRQQWAGFAGQPNTGLLNINGPIESIRSGIGISVYYDELGPLSSTAVRLSYAYHLKLSGQTKLSLGAAVGIMNSTVMPDWIAQNYSSDGVATGIGTGTGDNFIPQFRENATALDASFGAYIYNPKWYAGISAIHLPAGNLEPLNVRLARHYYLMAGYNFEITPQIVITPHIMAKTDLASAQFDANATVMYDNTFWFGMTYRVQDAVAPMAGYQYQMPNGKSTLRVGYSYDFTTSQLNNYSSGSHELMVSFCHKLEKPLPTRVYKNPRFL